MFKDQENNPIRPFATRSAWYHKDPNITEAFVSDLGEKRRQGIGRALQEWGRHVEIVSAKGLVDYDGELASHYAENWEGHYLLLLRKPDGLDENLVCRVKPSISPRSYFLSNEVYRHLRKHTGILAPELLPYPDGSLVKKVDDLFVSFSTYTPARPVLPSHQGDIFKAASGIAEFRKAMNELPKELVEGIRENAQKVIDRTNKGIEFILSDDGRARVSHLFPLEGDAEKLVSVAEEFRRSMQDEKAMAPCHGDLVPGSFYISDSEKLLLLGFNTPGACIFHRDIDIGVFFHRICLEKELDKNPSVRRAIFNNVIDGYNAFSNKDVGSDVMTPERLLKAALLGAAWKLGGAFGEFAQNTASYRGAEGKALRFGNKALGVYKEVMDFKNP